MFKKVFEHRVFWSPVKLTLLSFIALRCLGLPITSIVMWFNPWLILYIRKMFRRV